MADIASDRLRQRAAALLISRGYTRERAEELLLESGLPAFESADEWVEDILRRDEEGDAAARRRDLLERHHRDGIPPYEPPGRPDEA